MPLPVPEIIRRRFAHRNVPSSIPMNSSTEAAATSDSLIDAGMRGDLLALKVALVPCVIGYAEIATRLATRPDAHAATNPHRAWINARSDMFTFRAALRHDGLFLCRNTGTP